MGPDAATAAGLALALCCCLCWAPQTASCDSAHVGRPAQQRHRSELAHAGGLVRLGRSPARGPKMPPLAQRPRSTTTTTTTTSTISGTEPELEVEPEETAEAQPDVSAGEAAGEPPAPEPAKRVASKPSMAAAVALSDDYQDVAGAGEAPAEASSTEPARAVPPPRARPRARPAATPPPSAPARPAPKAAASPKPAQRRPSGRKEAPTSTTTAASTEAELGEEAGETEDESEEAGEADEEAQADPSRPASASAPVPAPATAAANNSNKQLAKKPLLRFLIKPVNESQCTPEAYREFPRDLIGDKWRGRGLVLVHVAVVCYMFYALALVCERYFMPSLEEFSARLGLSEDVAGATLMSAGSSAPELFTALLGVFIAKGDVGTGAIVGSAVFNILFVIGLCAFVSTTSAQLNWWPVLRDSVFYTFTVLVLIIYIYDEHISALESATMLLLYVVYIFIMVYNEPCRDYVTRKLLANPTTARLISAAAAAAANSAPGAPLDGPDDVFGSSSSSRRIERDSIYMAALLVIVRHKRLFRAPLRFQSAARYVIVRNQHRRCSAREALAAAAAAEVNYVGPDSESGLDGGSAAERGLQRDRMLAYAKAAPLSKNKFSIVSKDDYEFWNLPPGPNENYYLWLAKIPANYVLHYTIPDCSLYPDRYLFTFFASILWTAFFSYIMVWMVTLIGYTLGIPDSVMGVTFLAAGTSVPDCYSSIHAARNGMADMAVSNSIGSNVFDILIGLALPWFIQSALNEGMDARINSRGVIYSVVLLFLSLVVTIYLLNKYEWVLKPRLGLALLIAYGLFIILTCMLEFNLFGHVNPPPC